jgi:flagellar hook-basal body protein
VAGVPLDVTSASLQLNNTNLSAIGNVQIDPNLTMPPAATTQIAFSGNLDAAQQANASGGILNMAPGGIPVLPVAQSIMDAGNVNGLDSTRLTTAPPLGPFTYTNFTFQQVANLSSAAGGASVPIMNNQINLTEAKLASGNYAWEQQPPLPPACQSQQTVYDSLGQAHTITINFYQINDIGAGGVNSANGPSQTCYAWYAFDTSNGKAVSTANLLAGTGIGEGDLGPPVGPSPFPFITYDRGTGSAANPIGYGGDFIYFNTDGSLASSGGTAGIPSPPGPPNFMSIPRVYIPVDNFNQLSPFPTQGAEILSVDLDFGTFGVLGVGQRNGVTGDAQGSYQTVNGINTYVPDSHLTSTQNGYSDGTLQSVNFDETGKIVGSFSNGQTTALGQVALAKVDNEAGLTAVGNNHYQVSVNSGAETIGQAGQNGFGTIAGDSLEGSNVDLTVELSNMIVAQKGFDTNARMIATMNNILQVTSQLGL